MNIKDEIVLTVETDGDQSDAISQMEKLKATILSTKREQQDLQKAWAAGQLTAEEYISETVRLENSLKKNNAAYSETQKQVTGVKSGMDKLLDSNKALLGGLKSQATTLADKVAPGFGGAIEGVSGLDKAAWKFVLNPIGAIVAALGLALIALVSYFKSSEEGGDAFARVMAQAGAIVDVLVGRVIKLGEALFKFLTGDYQGGVQSLTESFSGLGDELEREVNLAGELADILDILEELELKHGVAVSESANQIKLYLIQAKDLTKTEEERLELQQKALDLQKKLAGEEQALRLAKLSADARAMQAKYSQFEQEQQIGESTIDFTKRLLANERISMDARKELFKSYDDYNKVVDESLTVQEKILNQQEKVKEKLNDRIQKEEELNQKAKEYVKTLVEKLEADDIAFKKEQEQNAERSRMAEKFREELGLNVQKTLDSATMIDTINKRTADNEVKFKRNAAAIKKQIDEQQLQATAQVLGQTASLFREHTVAYKLLATGETIINTYMSATRAYNAMAGIPYVGPALGAIAAATAIAAGLSNVARINGVKFARGGSVKEGTFGGRLHSEGGTKYYGEDGQIIEVERGENFYVLNRRASEKINRLSSLNVREGGVPWTRSTSYAALGGQIETQAAQRAYVDVVTLQNAVVAGVSSIKNVVFVEDIKSGLDNKTEVEERHQVL